MAAPHLSSLNAQKRALRRSLRGCAGNDRALCARLLAFLCDTPARVIGAVWPLPGEPDLRPVIEALDTAGRVVALPVVAGPDAPLLFRAWRPGETLVAGLLGTLHPAQGATVDPDLLLVPLLGFDRSCHRLGRGGGFYDRTLAARPGVRAIGFAYAASEIERVPAASHDMRLDAVVTEHEVIA